MDIDADRFAALNKPNYRILEFPGPPSDRPYVLVNMVASADGKTVIQGTERGLGSPTDQLLLHELRSHADVVLNGAGTLRASGTSSRLDDVALEEIRVRKGKARLPIAAILSSSGDLPLGDRLFTARDFDAVVYLAAGVSNERAEAIAATGRSVYRVPTGNEVPAMLAHMRETLGCQLLLLEGGPRLNGEFFRHALIDEFFLTISALITGGDRVYSAVETPGFAPTFQDVQRLELLSAHPNPVTNEIYLRYRILH